MMQLPTQRRPSAHSPRHIRTLHQDRIFQGLPIIPRPTPDLQKTEPLVQTDRPQIRSPHLQPHRLRTTLSGPPYHRLAQRPSHPSPARLGLHHHMLQLRLLLPSYSEDHSDREPQHAIPNKNPAAHGRTFHATRQRLPVLGLRPVRSFGGATLNCQNRRQVMPSRNAHAQGATRPTIGFAKISPSVRRR